MGDAGMWQVIAEVVKQRIKNIGNSGKNAQINGSTATGSVGLINPDFKKIDAKSENQNNENSVSQTTENTTKVENIKQEEPVESSEGESSGGSSSGGLYGLGSLLGNQAVGDMVGATVASDKDTKKSKDVSTNTKLEKANNIRKKIGEGLNKGATSAKVDGSVASFNSISPTVVSDERLKDIFGEETPIDCFAKIHSYEFKYTPEAQEIMRGRNHVDDKEHLGVMAQELLMNPATSACVIKDTDGFLKVDTAQLTMANTATIAELSRKVQQLEQMLGDR